MDKYITRIAPSPTGPFHIGTARTAIFNWAAARASGGAFNLRIDDTDKARNLPGAEQDIIDGLAWLGLDYDDTFRQSNNGAKYSQVAEGLLAKGEAHREGNGAVVLSSPCQITSWQDVVGGKMTVGEPVKAIVLLRADSTATYHFASVVDDHCAGVNFVVRGVDHISNVPRQLAIWSAINKLGDSRPIPMFAHVGLIFKDGKKLSKRDGSAGLIAYRQDGYDPRAVFNYLFRNGWGPSVDNASTTFIDRARAVSMFFAEGRMRASNSNFDQNKLDFYDRKYKARARVE